eukprot:g2455.t1
MEWPTWYGPGGQGEARRDLTRCLHSGFRLPRCLVALNADQLPVGTASLRDSSPGSDRYPGAWLTALLVPDQFRLAGIGTALVAAAEVEAARLGYSEVLSSTATAQPLFLRQDWQRIDAFHTPSGELEVFRKDAAGNRNDGAAGDAVQGVDEMRAAFRIGVQPTGAGADSQGADGFARGDLWPHDRRTVLAFQENRVSACIQNSDGIGGDCFAIVMEPDGRLTGFNGSGAAPKAATPEKLAQLGVTELSDTSPHAVTVPGAVRAWETLHKAHGSAEFKGLFKRAVGYARDGFPVAPRVARDWANNEAKLKSDPISAARYLIQGEAPAAGTILKYPHLAETLEKIAEGGADAFYSGAVAADIVEALQARGGLMTEDDLAACHTTAVSPVMRDYKGHTIAELPPNGQGVIALLILGILERFDLETLDPLGPERFHLEMEAARLAYAVRDRFVTDPGYMDVCHTRLIGSDYIDQLAAQVSREKRMTALPQSALAPQTDTVYLSIVDKDGLAVSFINSLFSDFGSGIVAPESGVLLHCRGKSFRVEPGHAASIDGGKRPMHTIIPAMGLKDGAPWLTFGVMGGHYQACGHAHLLTSIIDYGMDVQAAIDFPRMFFDLDSHALQAERLIPPSTLDGLRALGHEVVSAPGAIGGSQAIMIDKARHLLTAGSDPRKDGHAAGY